MNNTIEIDSFVQKALATWIAWASGLVEGWLFTAVPALNIPIVRSIIKKIIEWLVRRYSEKTEKAAFFFNTKVRATDQAKDFEALVDKVEALPDDVSDEEWERAEREKLAAFEQLMSLTK